MDDDNIVSTSNINNVEETPQDRAQDTGALLDAATAMDVDVRHEQVVTDDDDLGPRRSDVVAKRKASPLEGDLANAAQATTSTSVPALTPSSSSSPSTPAAHVTSSVSALDGSAAGGQESSNASGSASASTTGSQGNSSSSNQGLAPPPSKKAKNIEERLKALNASLYKVDRKLGIADAPRSKPLEAAGSPVVGQSTSGSPGSPAGALGSAGGAVGGGVGGAGPAGTAGSGTGAYPASVVLAGGIIKKTPVVKFKSLPPVPPALVHSVVGSPGAPGSGLSGGVQGSVVVGGGGFSNVSPGQPQRRGRGRPPSAARQHHHQPQHHQHLQQDNTNHSSGAYDGDSAYVPDGPASRGGRGPARQNRRPRQVGSPGGDPPAPVGVYVAEVVDIGVAPGTSRALERCYAVLLEIMRQEMAFPFTQPVDPVALRVPDYFDIIKVPMDLGTIKKRLEDGTYYTTAQQFAEHVRLVWANAFQYNQPQSDICYMAQVLSQLFETRFAGVIADEDGGSGGLIGDPIAFPAPYDGLGMDDHHHGHHHSPSSVATNYGGYGTPSSFGPNHDQLNPSPHHVSSSTAVATASQSSSVGRSGMPPAHHQSPAALAAAARVERKRQMKETIRELRDAMSIAAQQLRDLRIQGVSTSAKSAAAAAAAAAAANKSKKKKKYSSKYYKAMSFDEKASLSDAINALGPQYVAGVISIMEEELPTSLQSNAVELELDIDSLDTLVLRRLEAYVKTVTKPPRKTGGSGSGSGGGNNRQTSANGGATSQQKSSSNNNGNNSSTFATTANSNSVALDGGVTPTAVSTPGGATPTTPATPSAPKARQNSESSESESSSDSDSDSDSDDEHLAMAGMGAQNASAEAMDTTPIDAASSTQPQPVLRNMDMWSRLDDNNSASTTSLAAGSSVAAANNLSPSASTTATSPTTTTTTTSKTAAMSAESPSSTLSGAVGEGSVETSVAAPGSPSAATAGTGSPTVGAGSPAIGGAPSSPPLGDASAASNDPALWNKFAEKAMQKQQLEAARAEQEEKLRKEREEQQAEEERRKVQLAEDERKRQEQLEQEKRRQEDEMRRRREEERRKRESTAASVDMMGQGVAMGEFEVSLRQSTPPAAADSSPSGASEGAQVQEQEQGPTDATTSTV